MVTVSTSQWLTIIDSWLSGGLSTSQWLTIIDSWLSGGLSTSQWLTTIDSWPSGGMSTSQCLTTIDSWPSGGLSTSQWLTTIDSWPSSGLFTSRRTRTTRTPAFWDTPRHPMITHTSDSHQIPSQNKTKSKLQKIAKNWNFARNFTCDTPSEVAW